MPPVALVIGLAAAGAAAGYASSQTGKNKNDYKGNRNAPSTDNGSGGLNQAALGREQYGRDAQGRQGVVMDNTLGDQSRGDQYAALSEIQRAALGQQPSVAQLQMRQGLDQTIRNNAALAGAARGQSALALANQNAMVNNAMASQGIAGQMGVLRAQEMADARNAWMAGAGQIRGMDEGRAQTQAGLDAQQRALNDQMTLGMYGQGAGLRQGAVDARTAANAQAIAEWQYMDQMAQTEAGNKQRERQQNYNDVLGGAQAGATMGMSMGGGGGQGGGSGGKP